VLYEKVTDARCWRRRGSGSDGTAQRQVDKQTIAAVEGARVDRLLTSSAELGAAVSPGGPAGLHSEARKRAAAWAGHPRRAGSGRAGRSEAGGEPVLKRTSGTVRTDSVEAGRTPPSKIRTWVTWGYRQVIDADLSVLTRCPSRCWPRWHGGSAIVDPASDRRWLKAGILEGA
jgi:hypothetical protein